MRSKPIDAGVLSKIGYEIAAAPMFIPTAQANVVIFSFTLAKPGMFKIGHSISTHRDNSVTLVNFARQVTLDAVGLYTTTEAGVSSTQFDRCNISGERIKSLASGPHSLVLSVWGSIANMFYIDEGYVYVQEL